jgi:hypothetical protein
LNEHAAREQAERYDGDPWQEVIAGWLESRADVSIEQVLSLCIEKRRDLWTQADKNRIARCLQALNWERFRKRTGNNLEWRYRRPGEGAQWSECSQSVPSLFPVVVPSLSSFIVWVFPVFPVHMYARMEKGFPQIV